MMALATSESTSIVIDDLPGLFCLAVSIALSAWLSFKIIFRNRQDFLRAKDYFLMSRRQAWRQREVFARWDGSGRFFIWLAFILLGAILCLNALHTYTGWV